MKLKNSPSYPTPNLFCPFDESFFSRVVVLFLNIFSSLQPKPPPPTFSVGLTFFIYVPPHVVGSCFMPKAPKLGTVTK